MNELIEELFARYCHKRDWDRDGDSSYVFREPPRNSVGILIHTLMKLLLETWSPGDKIFYQGEYRKALECLLRPLPEDLIAQTKEQLHVVPCDNALRTQLLDLLWKTVEAEQKEQSAKEKAAKEEAKAKEAAEQAKRREADRLAREQRELQKKQADLDKTVERKRMALIAQGIVSKEVDTTRVAELRETLRPVSVADFLATDEGPREWLIPGMMVAREPMLIGGPKKALKTSVTIDLALSLASGRPFLGTYPVPAACSVALYSGESGRRTLQDCIRRIATARSIDPATVPFAIQTALPRFGDGSSIEALAREVEPFQVVILDPLYLALGEHANTASLTGIGALLTGIADALKGKTLVILHHTTKDTWTGRLLDLSDLAFAGVQEFARQWFLINRRSRFKPDSPSAIHQLAITYGGSAGHYGAIALEIDEGTLADRIWRTTATPFTGAKADKAAKADVLVAALLKALPQSGEPITRNKCRTLLKRNNTDTGKAIARAAEAGWVTADDSGVALLQAGRDRTKP